MSSWAVVVPSHRPGRLQTWLDEWHTSLADRAHLILVHDSPEPFTLNTHGLGVTTLYHADLPDWMPRKTDMIRSWGILAAWRQGHTYTLTLDDDVLPTADLLTEYETVFEQGAPCSPYLDVGALTTSGLHMRGFPYADRNHAKVGVQYGGWSGCLDYDAATQLAVPRGDERFHPIRVAVPRGAAFTGCIMNTAWRTEYAPLMWQLTMIGRKHEWGAEAPDLDGRKCRSCGTMISSCENAASKDGLWDAQTCDQRYNRFGDIWSGLYMKKVLDSLGVAVVVNGAAQVRHERASDPFVSLGREAAGNGPNEGLWAALGDVRGCGMLRAYRLVTDSAAHFFQHTAADPEYAVAFRSARDKWLECFEGDV